jgi:hypothetical protein
MSIVQRVQNTTAKHTTVSGLLAHVERVHIEPQPVGFSHDGTFAVFYSDEFIFLHNLQNVRLFEV